MDNADSRNMQRITTTIKREWLREIVAGRKKIEYRVLKPYWTDKLARIRIPFELRLINGMSEKAPDVTVVVQRVRKDSRRDHYESHLGSVLRVRHWNRRIEMPSA